MDKQGERAPFRDAAGNAIPAWLHLPAKSLKSQSGRSYDAEEAAAFIASETGAALYAALSCRRFEEKDKQHDNEAALVGQRMVVANAHIRKRTCLGIYEGLVIFPDRLAEITDRTYTLVVPILRDQPKANLTAANAFDDWGACLCIDGDGIIAYMNTTFAYDANGLPCAQASDGYNVDVAWFTATLGPYPVALPAFFALRDIRPGEELRWNYEYSAEAIADHVTGASCRSNEMS